MDKVRAFLMAAVGKDEVDNHIKRDHWVEFPTSSIGNILEKYERFLSCASMTFTEQIPTQDGYYWAKIKNFELNGDPGEPEVVRVLGYYALIAGFDTEYQLNEFLWGERIEYK